MAWTTPGTAVAGDVLTAAFWNEQVRDQFNVLGNLNYAIKTDTFSKESSQTSTTGITDLSATFTATASDSLILLFAVVNVGAASSVGLWMRFRRDGNIISQVTSAGSRSAVSAAIEVPSAGDLISFSSFAVVDASTSSEVTYDVAIRADNGVNWYVNRTGTDTDSSSFPRSISSLLVLELPK